MKKKVYLQNELDVIDLFSIIVERKFFIFVFTMVVTLLSVIYVFFKNPIPLYKGSILFEIGEAKITNVGNNLLDSSRTLKILIENNYKVKVTIPEKTYNLIYINAINIKKEKIKSEIKEVIKFIINRHKEKLKFYDDFILSKTINEIIISDTPINKPKKKFIVVISFLTGLMLSIILSFIIFFIKNLKKKDSYM